MTENVSIMDIANIVNNLQDILYSIQNSFNNNQKIISSFNDYILNNTTNITNLQTENSNMYNNLNDKFPLTNSSLNDESISITKIQSLSDKLIEMNNYLMNLKNQIDDKNELYKNLLVQNDILNIGNNLKTINIGNNESSNPKIINIGNLNDTINISGKLNSKQINNNYIENKTITLNHDSLNSNSSGLVGINIRDDNTDDKGYIMTNDDSTQILIKPPYSENVFKIKESPKEFYDLTTKLYVDTQNTNLQIGLSNLLSQISDLNTQINNMNLSMVSKCSINSSDLYLNSQGIYTKVGFNSINNFNSDNGNVLFGDGTFNKINNNVIENNSINPNKLKLENDNNKVLCSNGMWVNINDYIENYIINNKEKIINLLQD